MCNDNHNYELVDTIFSPDVRWEGSPDDPWGSAVGREAFIELFKGFQKQMDGRCLGHNITNPIIFPSFILSRKINPHRIFYRRLRHFCLGTDGAFCERASGDS